MQNALRIFVIFAVATTLIAGQSGAASTFGPEDPLYDDLGFSSGLESHRVGSLLMRVFSWSDRDASFNFNGVNLSYHKPPCTLIPAEFEPRLTASLERARTRRTHEWHNFALLLEAAAAYYRKCNRTADSQIRLEELVELLVERAPNSDELRQTRLALSQIYRLEGRYHDCERQLHDALGIARINHANTDLAVLQVQMQLYYLHFDQNRADKAILERKNIIKSCGYDYISEAERSDSRPATATWADILRSVDSVATTHDIADVEADADKIAYDSITKKDFSDDQYDDADDAPKPDDHKDKADNDKKKKPPKPHRIYRGNDDL